MCVEDTAYRKCFKYYILFFIVVGVKTSIHGKITQRTSVNFAGTGIASNENEAIFIKDVKI